MAKSNKDPNGTHEGTLGAGAGVEDRTAEDALVASLRAGSADALAALYQHYYREMVDLARKYVHHPTVAEEVVQDTWAAIIKGIGSFEEKCSFKTWAFRILANKAKRRYRRESRFSAIKRLLGLGASGDKASPFDSAGSWATPVERWLETPEQLLLRKEFLRELHEFLASLPARQRQVFLLRDVEGWSPEKVCESLGLTRGNQRVLLHRARAAIYRWYSSKTRGST